jgi:hypothetical protein
LSFIEPRLLSLELSNWRFPVRPNAVDVGRLDERAVIIVRLAASDASPSIALGMQYLVGRVREGGPYPHLSRKVAPEPVEPFHGPIQTDPVDTYQNRWPAV